MKRECVITYQDILDCKGRLVDNEIRILKENGFKFFKNVPLGKMEVVHDVVNREIFYTQKLK